MNLKSYFGGKVNKYFNIDLYEKTWAIFASETDNIVPVSAAMSPLSLRMIYWLNILQF